MSAALDDVLADGAVELTPVLEHLVLDPQLLARRVDRQSDARSAAHDHLVGALGAQPALVPPPAFARSPSKTTTPLLSSVRSRCSARKSRRRFQKSSTLGFCVMTCPS